MQYCEELEHFCVVGVCDSRLRLKNKHDFRFVSWSVLYFKKSSLKISSLSFWANVFI